MLKDQDILATIAVKDLAKARKFYEGTLGLKPVSTEGDEAVTFQSGNTKVLVYHSEFAGTNKATAATFMVNDEIDAIAKALKTKGVPFENYDWPNVRHDGDIHVMGEMRVAWFKDPDGNILAIVNGKTASAHAGME
jgi:catechol 2,3-dioxygenase-like lactoylglutathione lyase family enzyme